MLQHHPKAKINPPTGNDINCFIVAIGRKYPLLKEERVWGACDGLKLPLQQSENWAKQNENYNGWKSKTYINSIYVFSPDGLIQMATINAPGSWHDSTMADYGVYRKMERVYALHQATIVVDSAFNLRQNNYLIRSSQSDPELRPGATRAQEKRAVALNNQATLLRQLSEHGMRMIQGQFPRLKDNLQLEEFGERKVVLHLLVLLYNYQTSKVGMNQILNSFMSKTKGFESYAYTYYHLADGETELRLVPETANNFFI